ncbi:MAG: glycosyltransferase family 39 protein [Actinomycetota bacterium]|nr:glycosyltransferase family 39 protein [Actinomycetota bacterium]
MTVPAATTVGAGTPPRAAAPLWKPGVLSVAAAFVALELAMSARYGFHRDELYFLACSRHMAWGYVDQPPFVPGVAWLATHVFGTSATALRVFPALAGGTTVVLTALMARQLGGRKLAQLLAALAGATSPQVLAAFHLLSTACFDMFFWAAICYLVLRWLLGGDARLWLAIGALSGVALLNKANVLFLLVSLAVGLLLGGRARDLANRWMVIGILVALAIWSPNIDWNARHRWAAISMMHSLHSENSTLGASIGFIPAQLIVVGPLLIALWWPGLRRLLRLSPIKPLGIAFLVAVGLYTLSGAKPYYLAGFYFLLFAAGAVQVEQRTGPGHPVPLGRADEPLPAEEAYAVGPSESRLPVRATRRWILVVLAGLVVILPLAEPVLPQSTLPSGPWESKINKDLSATVGWPDLVRQISAVADTLPERQRTGLVVFTGDYGAAGAIDLWGPRYGLPHAISGHNNYWWWGPAGAHNGGTTIAVNLSRSYLLTIFTDVTPAGVVHTPGNAWTEERDDPIWICHGQKVAWAHAWPAARHYG